MTAVLAGALLIWLLCGCVLLIAVRPVGSVAADVMLVLLWPIHVIVALRDRWRGAP
jgi:hypothetical protein